MEPIPRNIDPHQPELIEHPYSGGGHYTSCLQSDPNDTTSQQSQQHNHASNWFSKYVLFNFFKPYMRMAKRSETGPDITIDQMPNLWSGDNFVTWLDQYDELAVSGEERYHVLVALTMVSKYPLIGLLLSKICLVSLSLLSVICFQKMLKWQEIDPTKVTPADRSVGLISLAGIILLEISLIFGSTHWSFWFQRVSIKLQGLLTASVYGKLLDQQTIQSLDGNKQGISAYNLLTIDIPSISNFYYSLVGLIIMPLNVILSFSLLFAQVGFSSYVGLGTLMSIVSIIVALEVTCGYLKAPLMAYKDMRLSRCHDAVSNIKSLKLVGWEEVSLHHTNSVRQKEMNYRAKRLYLDSTASSFVAAAYSFTQLAVISTYVILGFRSNSSTFVMKASVVLPVLQIINRLAGPLTDLPFTLNSLVEGWTSVKRYQNFISLTPSNSQCRILEGANCWTCGLSTVSSTKETLDIHEKSYSLNTLDSSSIPKESKTEFNERSPLLIEHEERRDRDKSESITNFPNLTNDQNISSDNKDHTIIIDQAVFKYSDKTPSSSFKNSNVNLKRHVQESTSSASRNKLSYSIGSENASNIDDTSPFSIGIDDLKAKASECLLITGPTGSGKTSALLAFLGELICAEGIIIRPTDIDTIYGYASQLPWIPEGTLRSVILFGLPLIEQLYLQVLQACQLDIDFERLPEKDLTWVSGGGEILSTGQKSRIGLARLLYHCLTQQHNSPHKKCILLIDDAFATLDPGLGFSIFENFFRAKNGLLSSATTFVVIDEINLKYYLSQAIEKQAQLISVTHWLVEDGKLILKSIHNSQVNRNEDQSHEKPKKKK